MPNNYLLIVEGANDEKSILSPVFEEYGFHVVSCKEKLTVDQFGEFEKDELSLESDNIVIIEGPRSRIHDFLLYFDKNYDSVERLFHYPSYHFSGIFLIYDVDHNDNEDIDQMFAKFCDESTGLLLLNSPCLEVLADPFVNSDHEKKYTHLKEYKKELNLYHQNTNKMNLKDYIAQNFNQIMLSFLKMNKEEFNETNIMEHPRLVKEKNNKRNIRYNSEIREQSYVLFRFFSTVLYVAIAYSNKLVNEIDNYQAVYSFFEKHISQIKIKC